MLRTTALLVAAIVAVAAVGIRHIKRHPAQPPVVPSEAPIAVATGSEQLDGLEFEKTDIDLGDVTGKVQFAFKFRNRANSPTVIGRIKPSCSCTVVQLRKHSYAPGEQGRIEVEFSVNSHEVVQKSYVIRVDTLSAENKSATHELFVRVRHVPDIVLGGPVRVRAMDKVDGVAQFHVVDYRERPLTIRALRATTPLINATVVETPSEYHSGWKYVIQIKCHRGGLVPGQYREVVTIETDDPKNATLPVEVIVDVLDRIRVLPASPKFSKDADGKSFSTLFFVDDAAGEKIEVESVKSDPRSAQVELRLIGDSKVSVLVRYALDPVAPLPPLIRLNVEIVKPTRQTRTIEVPICSDLSAPLSPSR